MRTVELALLLTGCTYGQVSQINQPGQTNIFLADQAEGKPAVVVYSIDIISRDPRRVDSSRRSFSLAPGEHVLSLNCYRPDRLAILDGSDFAQLIVPDGGSYVLDCKPDRRSNNFYFRKKGNDGVQQFVGAYRIGAAGRARRGQVMIRVRHGTHRLRAAAQLKSWTCRRSLGGRLNVFAP